MESTARNIALRSFEFAVRVVRLCSALPTTTAGVVLARQVLRSGTSIGANVEEAQVASSRRKFARKMGIACGEARETFYWLRLIREGKLLTPARLEKIIAESEELVRILTTIVKRARQSKTV